MGKWQIDAMLDEALAYITDNSAQIVLCVDQPADYSEATTDYGTGSGKALGEKALVAADFSAISDGSSGRKLTVPQVSSVTVDVTGSVTHLAIISESALLYVTTCVSQAVTNGSSVTIPEWDIEIRDAA
jgi:hypothetical protein